MKVIKFRGKRIDSDEWVFGYGAMYHAGFALILDAPGGVKVEPDSIGQWTGLRDKNDAEIFEGDIVKTVHVPILTCQTNWVDYTHGEIKWLRCGFNVCQKHVGANDLHYYYYDDDEPAALEVIGNVFENADLIEGK